jgi:3-hydroxymyristoyl/3-hydroxydecanoyl-(acyl carrier protein) dehydratase
MAKTFAETLKFQSDLMLQTDGNVDQEQLSSLFTSMHIPVETPQPVAKTIKAEIISESPTISSQPEPAFPRDMCMEFAIGSIGKVLGPMFDIVDTYKVRVRLPDEPLMLVDRIMSVAGEKGSLKSGKVVTEHDVFPGAWYLDGGRCPVCISIEAGQADLFLCSYLGIDLAVKGKRSYRLLDAVAKFHGGLPKAGDIIRYEIEIDRFINQGETYLFFFHFNGFIGDRHIISMRKGCAGFFTDKEVKDSGGIILTPEETAKMPGTLTPVWKDLVPFFGSGETYTLSDQQVNALRQGDLETAFGRHYAGKSLSPSLFIPGGRMKLVDRVLSIDPTGGRYSLGTIKAQADIHPDDWFLTCHFVDDKVMPGTLMYECCMHTLRILTMRMGWVTDQVDVCCEPVPEIASVLKCRGPVTVETKHVFYVVDIKEIGYMPEPYVIADAHMYAHDQHIVMFRDMSMKLSGTTQQDIERYWGK